MALRSFSEGAVPGFVLPRTYEPGKNVNKVKRLLAERLFVTFCSLKLPLSDW